MRGVVATGEFSISDVAWVEECLRQFCKRRVGLLCSCLHGDLRSDGGNSVIGQGGASECEMA